MNHAQVCFLHHLWNESPRSSLIIRWLGVNLNSIPKEPGAELMAPETGDLMDFFFQDDFILWSIWLFQQQQPTVTKSTMTIKSFHSGWQGPKIDLRKNGAKALPSTKSLGLESHSLPFLGRVLPSPEACWVLVTYTTGEQQKQGKFVVLMLPRYVMTHEHQDLRRTIYFVYPYSNFQKHY